MNADPGNRGPGIESRRREDQTPIAISVSKSVQHLVMRRRIALTENRTENKTGILCVGGCPLLPAELLQRQRRTDGKVSCPNLGR